MTIDDHVTAFAPIAPGTVALPTLTNSEAGQIYVIRRDISSAITMSLDAGTDNILLNGNTSGVVTSIAMPTQCSWTIALIFSEETSGTCCGSIMALWPEPWHNDQQIRGPI